MRVLFEGESADLSPAAMAALDALVSRLERQPDLRLQLKAYASGTGEMASRARRLSFSRALAVRSYLIERGVRGTRIDVRALGSDTDVAPRDRVDLVVAQ
jgi:outer membrane protein OmpA-like peptidoglycan-associated protein